MTVDDGMIAALRALAEQAAAAILAVYATPFEHRAKADESPVTAADEAAEAIILAGLRRLTPEIPVIAEEEAARGACPALAGRDRFWLVDPLDGTREFVSRNGEFTVNIGLIHAGAPAGGVVLTPVTGDGFAGAVGRGAWRWRGGGGLIPIAARSAPADGVDVLASRSHRDAETDRYLAGVAVRRLIAAGSSLKFCRIAAGEADLYPRFGPTMEWDTAAGHAVLAAAGGSVGTPDGAPLTYGKPGFRNPAFIARGA